MDAVILNTPDAKTMAEKMKVQIAAWCHFYWRDTNPGMEKFYCKLSNRAFNQVLRHEISACTWDSAAKVFTSPRAQAQTEMAAIAEFEQQDWVQQLKEEARQQRERQNNTLTPMWHFRSTMTSPSGLSTGQMLPNNPPPRPVRW